jgi:thiol-disulfide isomerase/thioredoxin
MARKALLVVGLVVVGLAGTVAALLAVNGAPVPAGVASAAADPARPYVVKLHARWCPNCLMTKDEWARIEETYAGRVNLVVLDVTTDAATERSRAEAERLALGDFFDEYRGATGIVAVLDGRTRNVVAEIGGIQPFDAYRSAIDAALAVPAIAR